VYTEHVKYLLPDLVLGRLEIGQSKFIEGHLRICAACQQEFDEFVKTAGVLSKQSEHTPTGAYFASIIPRVRRKIETRARRSWLESRPLRALALPLGTALLIIGVLMNVRIPIDDSDMESQFSSAISGLSPEDVVEAVAEEVRPNPWVNRQTQELALSVVGEHLTREHLLQHSASAEGIDVELPFNDMQLLRDLDESEMERLLQRLGERTTL